MMCLFYRSICVAHISSTILPVVAAVHDAQPANKRLSGQFRAIDKRNSASNIRSNEATPDRAVSGWSYRGDRNREKEGNGKEKGSAHPCRVFHSTCLARRCAAICDVEHDLSLREMREASNVTLRWSHRYAQIQLYCK